ncbi:hypothetical protein BGZ91_008686 [Linnemannia elongata]|nr:hypothetical protein BGZ91_008686 [Linnemannia elongata]
MTQQLERVHPLGLIGAFLDDDYKNIPTLKACSLVNREWHRHFAPFLWWRIIDDFDKVLLRLYKTKFAPTLPFVDPEARLEPEFLAVVENFIAKVDGPAIPMAIHIRRRTYIKTRCLMSFIILGYLCKPVKAIEFAFHMPPKFEIYNASMGCMVAPENVRMSEDYWSTEQRIESIITVLENSPFLEILYLSDPCLSPKGIPYRWRQLALPPPAVTEWSLTGSAEFLNMQGNTRPRRILPNPITLAQRNRNFHCSDDSTYPYAGIETLSMLTLRGISPHEQLAFALGLPSLKSFSFTLDPKLDSVHLPYKPGFAHLTSLTLWGNFNHEVLIRAASRLEYLHLTNPTVVDDDLFKTICKHSDTLETVFIQSRTATVDEGPGPHRILSTCHRLLEFTLLLPRFNCCPEMFRDHPWVCSSLQKLLVVPDCNTTGSIFTPLQAQTAFFQKIASTLTELKSLNFGGGTGSFGFKPHKGLMLLIPLKELEVLDLKSHSLGSTAELTVEHAKMVVSEWPKLRAITGLYHYMCREFVNYVQEHRPEVELPF